MEFSQSRLADRLVLGAIAHRISNNSGEAWPSIATIAREANLSERSVHYSIRALSAMGELEISQGKTRMGTNTYRMPRFLAWVQTLHPGGRVQSAHRGVQSTTKGVQSTAAKVSQIAPEPSGTITESSETVRKAAGAMNSRFLVDDAGAFRCRGCNCSVPNSRAAMKHHRCPKELSAPGKSQAA